MERLALLMQKQAQSIAATIKATPIKTFIIATNTILCIWKHPFFLVSSMVMSEMREKGKGELVWFSPERSS